jgi:hypothetical protein
MVSKGVVISNNYLSLTMLFFKHDELLALDPIFLGFVLRFVRVLLLAITI